MAQFCNLENLIFSSMSDGLLAFDTDCRYIAWNPAMEKISGMKATDVIGRVAFEIFPFLKEIGDDKCFATALDGGTVVVEERSFKIPESGHSGYFEGQYSPLKESDGKIIGGMAIIRDITERVHTQRKLAEFLGVQKGEERFRSLIDSVPHIVWVTDADGHAIFTNRFGLEYMGMDVEQTLGYGWTTIVHPDDTEPLKQVWMQSLKNGARFEHQVRFKRASDGTYRWVFVQACPVRNELGAVIQWIGTTTDIHEKYLASQRTTKLQELAVTLSRVVTTSEVLKIIFSEGMSALEAHMGFFARLTDDREQAEVLVAPGYESLVLAEWKRFPLHIPIPITEAVHLRRPVFVESLDVARQKYPSIVDALESCGAKSFAAIPMIVENNVIGILGVNFSEAQTFSEDHEKFMITLAGLCAQAYERARSFELERTARSAAESANAAKSRFLANVSHELRTPLCSITGYAELLQSPNITPAKMNSFVEGINRNGKILIRLIDDILDLSKIEAGQLSVERVEVNLKSFLEEMTEVLSQEAERKGIVFQFHKEPGTPANIISDPLRLQQILLNIAGNAIKFTANGSVRLSVGFRRRTDSAPDQLVFRVEDTGIGLNQEAQERLFRPFSQGHGALAHKHGGTGLGLVISRNLARILGGDVTLLSSAPREGTVFEITISTSGKPAYTEQLLRSASNFEEAVTIGDSLAGVRVLIADNETDIQVILANFLASQGAMVDVVSNGRDAIDHALKIDYDLVIMDLQMPLMNGFAAVSHLRTSGYLRPIVAITANALEDYRISLRSGFNAHLIKPIEAGKLLRTVLHFVRKRPARGLSPSGGRREDLST